MVTFPKDYKTLVPRLLSETMVTIRTDFISRINLTVGDFVLETKVLAKGLVDILAGVDLRGCTKHVSFDALVPSDYCNGQGHPLDTIPKVCSKCKGLEDLRWLLYRAQGEADPLAD